MRSASNPKDGTQQLHEHIAVRLVRGEALEPLTRGRCSSPLTDTDNRSNDVSHGCQPHVPPVRETPTNSNIDSVAKTGSEGLDQARLANAGGPQNRQYRRSPIADRALGRIAQSQELTVPPD